jgi:NADPH2:quinone reductase
MMRAQVINRFGDSSVFEAVDLPKPALKPGHVLIKVSATSVNPIDCKIRSGKVPDIAPEFPAILHGDVAGVVDCAGGVRGSGGALAEYMLADARLIAKKPRRLSMLQAAALPLVTITAWDALFSKCNLQAGQHVLIHGGAGGVGHVAIQLAKWRGAHVYATVRNDNDIPIVQSLGAAEVINATNEDVEHYVKRLTNGKGFDLVFDTVGGENLDRSLAAATIDGAVATTAARDKHELSVMHKKSLSMHAVFMLLPLLTGNGREKHGVLLQQAGEIVEAGKLLPLVDEREFSLNIIGNAHAHLESGKADGKVVVSISK